MFSFKRSTWLFALVLCTFAEAREKQIRLEDIEQDNLKSEMAIENSSEGYLKPPNVNAEQTAVYGPPENYDKNQYAVEEEPTSETPAAHSHNIYLSGGVKYVHVDREQVKDDLSRQATSGLHGSSYLGYIPAMNMHLVYLPQVPDSSAYENPHQQKEPSIVYQPVQQHEGNSIQETQEVYQQPQNDESGYVQVPVQENQAPAGYTYVLAPQYQEHQAEYDGKQQHVQYVNEPEPQQHYVVDNSVSQDQLVYPAADGVAPSTPYKTVSPHYQVQTQTTKLVPPAVAFHIPASGHTGDTPRVLSEHAHGISRPVYSHISGNLVNSQYKQQYSPPHAYSQSADNYPNHGIQNQGVQNHGIQNHGVQNHGIQNHGAAGYANNYYRKPASLLESYIPSSIQIEYLKRGYSKDPLSTYDLIARSGKYRFEGGFFPNQVYSTNSGGLAFGHYKRAVNKKSV